MPVDPNMSRANALWLAATIALAPGAATCDDAVTVPLAALSAAVAGWVSAETGLPRASRLPDIAFADHAELTALRRADPAGKSTAPSPAAPWPEVIALYDDLSATVFLPADWSGGTSAEISILVHEMAHHLQAEAGLRFACPAEREQAAFAAQEAWLEAFDSSLERAFEIDPLFLLVSTHCGF